MPQSSHQLAMLATARRWICEMVSSLLSLFFVIFVRLHTPAMLATARLWICEMVRSDSGEIKDLYEGLRSISREIAKQIAAYEALGVDTNASPEEIKRVFEMNTPLLETMSRIIKERAEYHSRLAERLLLDQVRYISRISEAAGLQEFMDHLQDSASQVHNRLLQSRLGGLVPPITRHHYVIVADDPNKDPVDMAKILSIVGVVNSTECQIFDVQNSDDTNKISAILEEAAGTVLKVRCAHGWNSRLGVKGLQALMEMIDGTETCYLQLTLSKEEHERMEEDGALSKEFLKVAKTFYLG